MSKSINQEKECCEKCGNAPEGKWTGLCNKFKACPCHSTPEEKECRHCADGSLCNQSWSKHKCGKKFDDTPTPKNVSWEERFEKKWDEGEFWLNGNDGYDGEDIDKVKHFISKEIAKTKEETLKKLRQEIEGMKKEVKNYWDADALYNQALTDLSQLLTSLMEEKQ